MQSHSLKLGGPVSWRAYNNINYTLQNCCNSCAGGKSDKKAEQENNFWEGVILFIASVGGLGAVFNYFRQAVRNFEQTATIVKLIFIIKH